MQTDCLGRDEVLTQLAREQRSRLLKLGRQVIPNLTPDDILQPNDFPELENYPVFRYEEGVLHGILAAQMAVRASESAED